MELFSAIEKSFQDEPQLRVFTNIKASRKFDVDAYEKANFIHNILKKINFECSKKDKNWKLNWLKDSKLNTKKSGVKEWFSGRSSIPLAAINALIKFTTVEDLRVIKKNCLYFCTKTSAPAYFPRVVSPELAWLVAAILCDGHMKNNCGGATFEVSDLELAKKVGIIFSEIFKTKQKCPRTINRVGYNRTYSVEMYSAPAALFLNKIFGIPFGYKCDIIFVPDLIKQSDLKIKKAFLKGVFDTDGGKRGGGLGLTSLSIKFIIDVGYLLKEFNINPHNESWINKRYNKKCYGLRFKIDIYSRFLMRQSQSALSKEKHG